MMLSKSTPIPLSSEHGTHKTVKAKFWPWLSQGQILALAFQVKALRTFEVVPFSLGSGNRHFVRRFTAPAWRVSILKLTFKLTVCFEAGSYLRRIDSCVTQLKAQGLSRNSNESKEEEEEVCVGESSSTPSSREQR